MITSDFIQGMVLGKRALREKYQICSDDGGNMVRQPCPSRSEATKEKERGHMQFETRT